jgi:hypothetical protein
MAMGRSCSTSSPLAVAAWQGLDVSDARGHVPLPPHSDDRSAVTELHEQTSGMLALAGVLDSQRSES